MKRTISLVAAVLCGVGLATAAGAGPATADPGAWSVVTLPLPADSGSRASVTLGKGACGAPGQCVIPGSYRTNRNKTEGLIVTVSDGVPTAQAVPAPVDAPADPRVDLIKASCPSSGRCVAVGRSQIAGELVWQTASGWRAITAPVPAGYDATKTRLYDVTCAGGVCFAVGSVRTKPLVERFANGTWTPTVLSTPSGTSGSFNLRTVSCSSSRHCVAAGDDYLGGVPGVYGSPLGAVWDGTSWTTSVLPQPADVSTRTWDYLPPSTSTCVAGGTCHVLGAYPPTTRSVNSRPADFANDAAGWTATGFPNGSPVASRGTIMYDIHCSAATSCVAVGLGESNSTGNHGVIATRTAAGWSVTYAPGPGQAHNVFLTALGCVPGGACTGFGYAYGENISKTKPIATTTVGTPSTTALPLPADYVNFDSIRMTAMYDGTRQLVASTYSGVNARAGALWMRTV